ncbi:chemotaxis protein CheB [Mycolicibacterium chubuense]|nr:chemotaxis protein CheB [Mycolicibacterium chubuense]
MGGSAGGVEALTKAAAGLPEDLPYAVLMTLHLPAHGPSVLAQIIDRAGPLPAVSAEDGAPLRAGHIYTAVPGRHLLVRDHHIALSEGPTENGHRPAINALFRSAAVAFGPRAIGVLLSGVLDDGVLGLVAIRSRGGTTLCQEPADALFPTMPSNALRAGVVDQCAAASDIGRLLGKLAERDQAVRSSAPDPYMELENRIAMSERFAVDMDTEKLGPPSGFTCPDCSGSLQALGDDNYRCHIGHAWTAEALLSARDHEVQNALWIAVRSLDEKSRLAHRLRGQATSAAMRERFSTMASETEHALAVLRERLDLIENGSGPRDG